MKRSNIKAIVREGYGRIARGEGGCCNPVKTCCGTTTLPEEIGKNIGYSRKEMKAVPEGSNLGLGCGNPVALAALKKGETVLDLGSGAGFDAFLVAKKVGPRGKVIGVDMTPEMVKKARGNARRGGYKNVTFLLGEIEALPLEPASVDVVISNCVINLSPDKEKVFREAYRVLKTGGRLMVSDIVTLRSIPPAIKRSIAGYVGCLSGAVLKREYLAMIRAAGFDDVRIVEETSFPITAEDGPAAQALIGDLQASRKDIERASRAVVSAKVFAVKKK